MQEKPDNQQPDEQPLSSEAPDELQNTSAEAPASADVQELAQAAEVAVSTEPGAEPTVVADETAEQPDGVVEPAESADDLVADANAVDPKIDVGLLEAYLFATHSPLTPGRLAELFNLESTKPIRKALRVLNEQYVATGRCFRVEQVAGGFQLLTVPEYGDHLKALHQKEADAKLTKAALETLAIIAYKQPILRADLEAIRGVASGETIRSLMEKHLVKIAGRAEEPGRPILYGTTRRFLEVFGLNSLKDLPHPDSSQGKAQLSRAAQTLLADAPAESSEAAPADATQEAAVPLADDTTPSAEAVTDDTVVAETATASPETTDPTTDTASSDAAPEPTTPEEPADDQKNDTTL